jgi:two-component system sensor histidine kinase MprB
VTALAAIAVGLAVAVVALAGYFTVRHQLYASLDRSLFERAEAAARSDVLAEMAEQSIPSWMVGAADVRIGFITSDGTVVTSDRGLSGTRIILGDPELDVAKGVSERSVRTISTNSGEFRVAAVPAGDAGEALVLAQSLRPTHYTLSKLSFVLLLFGFAGVLAGGLAGWLVARNGLRPVRALTEAAEAVARTEQLIPIDVLGDDELARMAKAFNSMLTALAASRDLQRQLIADASHELRTPLTSLRTNLDLLVQADHAPGLNAEQRQELMSDVSFQIGELTELIGDLTELAREDRTPAPIEVVDLCDVIDRAVDRVRRRVSSVQFEVRSDAWYVDGEDTALERAVTNLLDNAAKWSPPLGTVSITLVNGDLTIADEGPGIADEDAPHVFDRFYRSKAARAQPGSGLGLSIVKHVAERHGGAVVVGRSARGGAMFTMFLPGRSSMTKALLTAEPTAAHREPSADDLTVEA